MSHRTAEVSSSLAPDPEQPSTLMRRQRSLTGAADPKFDLAASPVAPEHKPWPQKMLPRWLISNLLLIIQIVLVIFLVVLLTVLSVVRHSVGQAPPNRNGASFGCDKLRRPN